jgi:hypothetical protein
MLCRYFESLGIKKDNKKEDPKEKDDVKDKKFPLTCLSTRQRKRERREVFFV